jgi:hypothetical protein
MVRGKGGAIGFDSPFTGDCVRQIGHLILVTEMFMAVVPAAKAMYLCDYHIGYSKGKVDLYGLFNAIRPELWIPLHQRTILRLRTAH